MTAATKWLLSNHWTGRLVVDVEIARSHFQIFDSLFQKCPLKNWDEILKLVTKNVHYCINDNSRYI